MTAPGLAGLFPDEDYGFRLTLQRREIAAFFAPSARAATVLAERRRWLAERPGDFVVRAPGDGALWREAAALTGASGDSATALGGATEADMVLLQPDAFGVHRVRAGVVVFPTAWSLPEKAGFTLAETHGVVPGLNAAIGAAIDRFLAGLKPGLGAARSNWGLAATPELNLHPALERPRLTAGTPLEQVWLRVEHQVLARLPQSGAVLFGIRLALHPLAAVLAEPAARSGLGRALATMPPAMAAYKGLTGIMPDLRRWTAA